MNWSTKRLAKFLEKRKSVADMMMVVLVESELKEGDLIALVVAEKVVVGHEMVGDLKNLL
jgi:hypothetical protein